MKTQNTQARAHAFDAPQAGGMRATDVGVLCSNLDSLRVTPSITRAASVLEHCGESAVIFTRGPSDSRLSDSQCSVSHGTAGWALH